MLSALPGGSAHRRAFRFRGRIGLLVVALQATAFLLGPIADGRLEARSVLSAAHVEAPGQATCAPVHSLSDCIICRTMADRGLPAPTPAALVPVDQRAHTSAAGLDRVREVVIAGAHGSRAPPRGAPRALHA